MAVSAALRRPLAIVATAALSVVLLTGAVTEEESVPAQADCDSAAASDEAAAVDLAARCDRSVEVVSARTAYSELHAEPDGRMRLTTGVAPMRARAADGSWTAIDTTLRATGDRIRPGATVHPVSLSPGGDRELVRTETGDGGFTLTWPDPLPRPVLDGDTARYPGVYPGVDLTVTATPEGFSHSLVISSAEAAADPRLDAIRFGLHTDGVTVAVTDAGGLTVSDTAGEPLWTTPTPQMWDASGADTGAHRAVDVPVTVTDDSLVLHPDRTVFTSAETVYPVTVDPLWNGGGLRSGQWTTAWSKYPTSSFWKRDDTGGNDDLFGAAKVGRVCDFDYNGDCLSSTYRVRSFFRMDTEGVQGRQITAATFKILQKHAWQCSPKSKAQVWRTSLIDSTHTWDNQPDWTSETAVSHDYANYRAGCGTQGLIEFDVTAMVQKSADSAWKSISLGMKAIDESTLAHWKRYDHSTAKIDVYYNSIPGDPAGMFTGTDACVADWNDPGIWQPSTRPELRGRVTDADGKVRARVQVWIRESADVEHELIYDHTSGDLASGTEYRWRPPADLAEGYHHWWRMQATDGSASSAWSQWCYLRVDATAPEAATVTPSVAAPMAGDTVALTFHSGSSDVTGFRYGLNSDAPDQTVAATGGTATVTWPALPAGPNTVYVWAQDRVGNLGPRSVLNLYGGRTVDAAPQGVWRFDGDPVDDSGNDHDLAGVTGFTGDRLGRPGAALSLTGDTCPSTAGPAVRTDGPFTVTAWVRIDATATDQVVLSQFGGQRAAFELRYSAAANAWAVAVPAVDEWSPELGEWAVATGPSGVEPGVWVHLAAQVDPVADMIRLHVDGEPVADAALPFDPWRATGPLATGCAGGLDHGLAWNHLHGAVDSVSAWNGLMPPAGVRATADDLPVGHLGSWSLDVVAAGSDAGRHGNDFTLPAGGDHVEGFTGRDDDAWRPGDGCATTAGPVLRTDDSFTVAAWTRLDASTGDAVLLGQDGRQVSPVALGYDAETGSWALWLHSEDSTAAVTRTVAGGPALTGEWVHLAVVYDDAEGTVTWYVDGVRTTDTPVDRPFQGTGPLRLGCAASTGDMAWPGAVASLHAWRGAADDAQIAGVHGGNPSVKELSMWALEGDGTDSRGGSDLNLHGDYEWVEDRVGWPGSALGLRTDGTGYAATDQAVADPADSFTVAAWVRLDDASADRTVLSQVSQSDAAFVLRFDAGSGRWVFAMPSGPASAPVWHEAVSDAPAAVGSWVHLTAVYDRAAGTLRLHVDGVPQAEAPAPATTWTGDGPLLLAARGDATGGVWDLFVGAVDDVRVWRGVVHPDRIRDLAVA
ncbi:concanavalin A-like lectin/glucanase superfamily protein [Stackebrandtia albiflava]|uniref:Concanavalin A-like lectin/glucanase superfamily protein n=1 Tax=Stackebrandtia albiflava TaxID=406432 RepID=A0A562V9L6_9ACTN|nr:LamG-like jellyroll fold domain-containing protein [Stackebrandtia albiflava]TWJ14574.1 concanavalin A-like lectin/glucanase superfamily protein [Stackebrandtia albiflava]